MTSAAKEVMEWKGIHDINFKGTVQWLLPNLMKILVYTNQVMLMYMANKSHAYVINNQRSSTIFNIVTKTRMIESRSMILDHSLNKTHVLKVKINLKHALLIDQQNSICIFAFLPCQLTAFKKTVIIMNNNVMVMWWRQIDIARSKHIFNLKSHTNNIDINEILPLTLLQS